MPLLSWIQIILNLVGLLLWLRWREATLAARRPGLHTLLSTLKRAGRSPVHRLVYPAILAGLLLLRGIAGWQMGSGLSWTPCIDLGAIVIPFRSDMLNRMLLFSGFSQAVFIVEFYFWLLLISVINRRVPDTDPIQNRIRAHLGVLERCPAGLKLMLPPLTAGALWLGLGPLLAGLGFQIPARSLAHTFEQAAVLGLASILVWKYFLAGLMLLHLVTSHVYFGDAPFWSFTSLTARNLLGAVTLRVGKIDLAPLAAAALALVLGELLARQLPRLYQALPL